MMLFCQNTATIVSQASLKIPYHVNLLSQTISLWSGGEMVWLTIEPFMCESDVQDSVAGRQNKAQGVPDDNQVLDVRSSSSVRDGSATLLLHMPWACEAGVLSGMSLIKLLAYLRRLIQLKSCMPNVCFYMYV